MPHRGKIVLKPPDLKGTTRIHMMWSEKEEEELVSQPKCWCTEHGRGCDLQGTSRNPPALHHGAGGGHTQLDRSKSETGNELQPSQAACRSLEPREGGQQVAAWWQLHSWAAVEERARRPSHSSTVNAVKCCHMAPVAEEEAHRE